jgi:two-component system chemotaxis sensor kinase CheA
MSSNDKAAGDSSDLLRAAELLAQIGEELAFVVPDGDAGLLPINRFVMDLEEWVAPTAAGPWTAGLKVVRLWLDEILDGSGKFTEDHIRLINEWHAYVSSVLDAWLDGGGMPDWPSGWDRSLVPGATTPVAGVPKPAADSISTQPPAPDPSPSAVLEPIGDEPSIRLNLDEDLELLREFHAESLELLQGIEQGVLVLETTPADTETINSIFRAFHTFKGGAGFLHLDAPRHLAHELETLLDLVRRSELRINAGIINLILAGADALRQFTHAIGAQLQGIHPGALIVVPTSDIIRRAKSAARGESVPPPVPAPPAPALAPVVVQPAPSTPIAGFPKSDRTSLEPVPQAAPEAKAPLSPAAPAREPVSGDPVTGFVKLDTAKLDSLVDLVGELVVAQSMVVQNQEVRSIESPQFVRLVRQLSRITGDLQRTAMSMRMVPIRGAFQKMTRLVRDLAASQHKQVQLLLEGEETELDRNIVEKLGDPLIHMIRNSLDHGIEAPADRIAQGKPAQGTIRLSAAHQRGGIVIRITDDGKGLNPDRIRAKALERALIRADAELDESEIFSLIFLPGFSTAERVTDLSGRGVGMDVVRRNIEGLRGKIEIQSVPGEGTQFTIVLPLTLAIIDGMLVGVGEDRYIIPTLSIRESFRPQPGMVSTIQGCGEVVSVRGRQTPLLRLGRHLDRPFKASKPEDAIIVVVESGDASRGLLVDELLGKQEVVIKSLGQAFQNQSLLAGSAVLGDGSVGLILDVDTLVKAPGHRKISATATATPGP